jgi:hypothetical protein
MLITSFDKPIIFRVTQQFSDSTELIIRKWLELDNIKSVRNQYFLDQFYATAFPLNWPILYIVCVKWTTPCQIFNAYNASKKDYYWISIDNEQNLVDFDALLRLQYRSSLNSEIVEDTELVKGQLLAGVENITIRKV